MLFTELSTTLWSSITPFHSSFNRIIIFLLKHSHHYKQTALDSCNKNVWNISSLYSIVHLSVRPSCCSCLHSSFDSQTSLRDFNIHPSFPDFNNWLPPLAPQRCKSKPALSAFTECRCIKYVSRLINMSWCEMSFAKLYTKIYPAWFSIWFRCNLEYDNALATLKSGWVIVGVYQPVWTSETQVQSSLMFIELVKMNTRNNRQDAASTVVMAVDDWAPTGESDSSSWTDSEI